MRLVEVSRLVYFTDLKRRSVSDTSLEISDQTGQLVRGVSNWEFPLPTSDIQDSASTWCIPNANSPALRIVRPPGREPQADIGSVRCLKGPALTWGQPSDGQRVPGVGGSSTQGGDSHGL